MDRQTNISLVAYGFALLIIAFVFVLFKGSFTSDRQVEYQDAFAELQLGQATMLRYHGDRVWAAKLTARYHTDLKKVTDQTIPACLMSVTICIVEAAIPNSSVELVYVTLRPDQLKNSVPWFGGYVNPISGHVYDLYARPYISNSYTSLLDSHPAPLTIVTSHAK